MERYRIFLNAIITIISFGYLTVEYNTEMKKYTIQKKKRKEK